jgi:hypothetical protein
MRKKTFYEYLSAKGHADETGIVDLKADQVDIPKEKITAKDDPQNAKKSFQGKNIEHKDGKQPQVKEDVFTHKTALFDVSGKKRLRGVPVQKEYLDGSGKLIEKPKIEEVPDIDFTPPATPPSEKTKGKGWDTKAPAKAGKPAPYAAVGKDPGQGKGEQGLADKGSIPKEEIKVEKGDSKYFPGGKDLGDWSKKTKTEAFINETKGLPLSKFVKWVLTENAATADVPPNLAFPPQAVRYVASLAETNGNILRNLLVELKNKDLLEQFFAVALDYSESYETLSRLLSESDQRCNALARAMSLQEEVGPFIGGEDDSDEESLEGDESDEETEEDIDQALEDEESELANEVEGEDESGDDDEKSPEGQEVMDQPSGGPDAAMSVPESRTAYARLIDAMDATTGWLTP